MNIHFFLIDFRSIWHSIFIVTQESLQLHLLVSSLRTNSVTMPPRSNNNKAKSSRGLARTKSAVEDQHTSKGVSSSSSTPTREQQLLEALAVEYNASMRTEKAQDKASDGLDDDELSQASMALAAHSPPSSSESLKLTAAQRARETLFSSMQSQLLHDRSRLEKEMNTSETAATSIIDDYICGVLRRLNNPQTLALFRRHLMSPSDKGPTRVASDSRPLPTSTTPWTSPRPKNTSGLPALLRESPVLGPVQNASPLVASINPAENAGYGTCKVRALAWTMLLQAQDSNSPHDPSSIPSLEELLALELSILREKKDDLSSLTQPARDLLLDKVTGALPRFVPEQVIYNDIERSLWTLYPEEDERLARRRDLKECLYRILLLSAAADRTSGAGPPKEPYHYYQGLHEMMGHILYVMKSGGVDFETAVAACNVAVRRCFAPMCAPSLMHSEAMLRTMHFIIIKENPKLASLLEKVTLGPSSHFAVSWLLTWFSHEIDSQETLYFIFDLLLCMAEDTSSTTMSTIGSSPAASQPSGLRNRRTTEYSREKSNKINTSTSSTPHRNSADEIIYWCAALMLLFSDFILAEHQRLLNEEESHQDHFDEGSVDSSMHFGMLYSIVAKLPHRILGSPMDVRDALLKEGVNRELSKRENKKYIGANSSADDDSEAENNEETASDATLQIVPHYFSVCELFERVCQLRDVYPILEPLVVVSERHMTGLSNQLKTKGKSSIKQGTANKWDDLGKLAICDSVTADLEATYRSTIDEVGSAKGPQLQRWLAAATVVGIGVAAIAAVKYNDGSVSVAQLFH